jgi:hypothetical protein
VPDTIIFKDGRPFKAIKTEANGFITTVKGQMTIPEMKRYIVH